MKTIEKRAVVACDAIPYDVYIHSSSNCEDSFKDGYIAGANEQKEIDEDHFREVTKMLIDKACEWLEEQLYTDDGGCLVSDWYQKINEFLAAFREAMEK